MVQSRVDFDISPGFFIAVAAAMLILPLRLVIAWLAAAAIHELAHIAVLTGHIIGIRILPGGARIQTLPLSTAQEFHAALAGPVASLLLIAVYRIFPLVAFCGLIQFFFNILPIYPMDGGRVTYCLFRHFFGPKRADKIMRSMCFLFFLIITLFSGYAAVKWKTLIPGIISSTLILRTVKGKIPCKYRGRGVQ